MDTNAQDIILRLLLTDESGQEFPSYLVDESFEIDNHLYVAIKGNQREISFCRVKELPDKTMRLVDLVDENEFKMVSEYYHNLKKAIG